MPQARRRHCENRRDEQLSGFRPARFLAALPLVTACAGLTACADPATDVETASLPPFVERVAEDASSRERVLIDVLRDRARHVVRLNHTPGLNLAMALGGRVVWEAGFGFADLGGEVPMTPDVVTHSGSMGKTYTGTAVMQLVEGGSWSSTRPSTTTCPDGGSRTRWGAGKLLCGTSSRTGVA